MDIADIYIRRKQFDLAHDKAQIALTLIEKTSEMRGLALCKAILGKILYETGDLRQATQAFYEAVELSKKTRGVETKAFYEMFFTSWLAQISQEVDPELINQMIRNKQLLSPQNLNAWARANNLTEPYKASPEFIEKYGERLGLTE